MFVDRQSGGFARCAARDKPVRSFVDLPLDEFTEYRVIDSSCRKRSQQGGYRAEKHAFSLASGF
jgi:hypothetical protein